MIRAVFNVQLCIRAFLVQVLHGAVQVAKVAVVVGLTALATDKLQKEYITRKVQKPHHIHAWLV